MKRPKLSNLKLDKKGTKKSEQRRRRLTKLKSPSASAGGSNLKIEAV